MDVTLDQLRALDAVARTGSFGGAARVLHKVPSAVSYTIKGLEQALGLTLFDRRRRTATLTPAGQRILDAGRLVLREQQVFERLAQALGDGWEPELRVVVDGALPMAPLARCLRVFGDAQVPTRLVLDVAYRHGVLDRFAANDADLMLVIGFDDADDVSGYHLLPLPPLELVLVGRGDHPDIELLVRDSSPRVDTRSFTDSRHQVHLTDFHTKRLALLAGAGFGWMPLHLVDQDLDNGVLALQEQADLCRWAYKPQLVWRKEQPPGRAGQLFIKNLEL